MEYPDWLIDILEFFPIEGEEINNYVSSVSKTIAITYENEEYQFCYLAIHILFMTYIYTTVWKISQQHKNRFLDSSLFARPYNNETINFNNIKSVFEFSKLPEKEIFKFLSLIDIDNGFIGKLPKLVDKRNSLAHASGNVIFDSLITFEEEINNIALIISNINKKMNITIRKWYEDILLSFCNDKFLEEYETPIEIIEYFMIDEFSLSLKELEVCKNMGISKFRDRTKYSLNIEQITKIKKFHSDINKYFVDIIK
ncbi:MAG: hypothetical protein K8S23_08225 [Candidatus Cloacimonetes bacterium]|nr:hypothetical protein [Candidatus Cloacimonadota bacterium]